MRKSDLGQGKMVIIRLFDVIFRAHLTSLSLAHFAFISAPSQKDLSGGGGLSLVRTDENDDEDDELISLIFGDKDRARWHEPDKDLQTPDTEIEVQ